MADAQERTLQALKTALRMEIDGKEFYLKSSKASTNNVGKKLLKRLAEEEEIHQKVFENIYQTISNKQGWPEVKTRPDTTKGLKTVFSEAMQEMSKDVKTIPTEISAIETAMDMENKTYDYYKEQIPKAGSDVEREFYQALSVQEEEHHRVLREYYEFLKNPAAYFVETEHPHLDGG